MSDPISTPELLDALKRCARPMSPVCGRRCPSRSTARRPPCGGSHRPALPDSTNEMESKHSKCIDDILDVLEAAKKAQSRTRIPVLAGPGRQGMEPAPRRPHARPHDGRRHAGKSAGSFVPGYRLPEWEAED